jgi:hypothetical protein
LERHVGVVLIVASPRHRSVIIALPQIAVHDKNAGSSSRPAARPAREDQWVVRPRMAPSGTGTPELQRAPPRQADPPRRSEERPAPVRNSLTAPTAPTQTPCRGAGRGRGRQTRRRLRVRRWRRIPVPLRGACSHCLSGAAEPRMFTFPSSLAGAKD